MRQCKGWTQEEIANKLHWAINSYAKIERGETDIKLEKLKKVAEIMEVDVQELIDSNEKTIFNFVENCHSNNHCIVLTETQCVHELEKSQLIIEQKNKEIDLLRQQISDLREVNTLLKTKSN
ncbi:helix-turn-helix transcriptional regulator [Candidatus Halobeggiatoa sp. HSG11]|nr:helix-turn-helix transcriptional regulator [Candidatus Halobeggiatoa sp. HSG11]